jgi:pyruvate formate lyase activating enzyme
VLRDARPGEKSRLATASGADNLEGLTFDIKRFAVHDGPGVRTTVFLKGCPLRCVWCHNPEAISRKPEVFFHPERCIACLNCVEGCPNGAQQVTPAGQRVYVRELCQISGRCVEDCYSGALELAGRPASVDDVMVQLREDAAFYENSGGGITLSGGEPLLQNEFSTQILRRCKAEGFHTALDTCGQVQWRVFELALPYVDLVLYDLKHISPEQHQRYTGANNRLVVENLRRLSDYGASIEVRMVIIPTINDSREFIEGAARMLASLENITAVRILPYHRLAGSKYTKLGKDNTMPDVEPPGDEAMLQIASWIRQFGLEVVYPQAG